MVNQRNENKTDEATDGSDIELIRYWLILQFEYSGDSRFYEQNKTRK